MNINLNEINIQLSNDSDDFKGNNKQYCIDYINNTYIIQNKGNFSKLNNKMFKFDETINFYNYDFSDRFFNINVIISLLKIFNLTTSNTYEIYKFFDDNKEKYNIWKYLNNAEYIYCNTPSEYDLFVIFRVCLSYSWKECL